MTALMGRTRSRCVHSPVTARRLCSCRLLVEPGEGSGLDAPSRLMVDKIVTVPRSKLALQVGWLTDRQLVALNRAIAICLGLAG